MIYLFALCYGLCAWFTFGMVFAKFQLKYLDKDPSLLVVDVALAAGFAVCGPFGLVMSGLLGWLSDGHPLRYGLLYRVGMQPGRAM